MAKLTEHDKKLLIADYHTNKYSQRELAKKYNVSLGTVSNLTKEISPFYIIYNMLMYDVHYMNYYVFF